MVQCDLCEISGSTTFTLDELYGEEAENNNYFLFTLADSLYLSDGRVVSCPLASLSHFHHYSLNGSGFDACDAAIHDSLSCACTPQE